MSRLLNCLKIIYLHAAFVSIFILLLILCLLGRLKYWMSPLLSLLGIFFKLSVIIQSSIICLGLPLVLCLSYIYPSMTVRSSQSLLVVCPIHFHCLFLIAHINALASLIFSNIYVLSS